MDDNRAPMQPYEHDSESVADYSQQSRVFLARARAYLVDGDLHQASEKGWGAAAWMAKAVAESHGWKYTRHNEFFKVMHQARQQSGDSRLRTLTDTASTLHGNYYEREIFLYSATIGEGLADMELLLDILQPLTDGA